MFFFIILLVLSIQVCLCQQRQRTELKHEQNTVFEFVHIAKNGGRAVKGYDHKMKKLHKESPFAVLHKHKMKSGDVERKSFSPRAAASSTTYLAVFVLRDPVDRFESAFTFVRTGGFGIKLHPDHGLQHYNSSDSLISDLRLLPQIETAGRSADSTKIESAGDSRSLSSTGSSAMSMNRTVEERVSRAQDAMRCDNRMMYCSRKPADIYQFNLYLHTSIEFRPQTWWITHKYASSVRVVCMEDISTVFPRAGENRGKNKQNFKRIRATESLKGYSFVQREVASPENRAFINRLYAADYALYNKHCGVGASSTGSSGSSSSSGASAIMSMMHDSSSHALGDPPLLLPSSSSSSSSEH